MKGKNIITLLSAFAIVLYLMLFGDSMSSSLFVHFVFAHCDTEDCPVVTAAQKALETGNVNLVLIWVRKDKGTTNIDC